MKALSVRCGTNPVAIASAPLLAALALTVTSTLLRADEFYDFNQGNDAGWSHFDLTATLNFFGIPGTYAEYTFPSDGQGGFGYRIQSEPPPIGDAGPGRAFAFHSTSYDRAVISADMISWKTGIDQAFGILFRANDIGLGTTAGYVFNYNVKNANLQLNTIANEAAADTIAEVNIPMNPVNRYRWVLSTYDDNFLGQVFLLPDTNNPIASVVASEGTTASGAAGVFNFDRNDFGSYQGADSTFDNFGVKVPAAGSLYAITEALVPAPGASVFQPKPVVQIAVLDRETSADRGSFVFSLDGQAAPANQVVVTEGVTVPNNAVPFGGATATWTPTANISSGLHAASVTYADGAGHHFTNTWNFRAIFLDSPVVGTPGASGFNVFVVQAPQDPVLPNNLATAEAQLVTNSTIARLYATNVTADSINYSAAGFDGNSKGTFDGDAAIPGQIDSATVNNWAMAVTTYLDLPAGLITLGVQSDDSYSVSSGGVVLGQHDNGPANESFQFYVANAGLYPFRLVWEQGGGDSYLEWFEVPASGHTDTGGRVLLNTSDAYKAYQSVVLAAPTLLASASVSGPYTPVTGAVADTGAKTFTVPVDGTAGAQFFRVSAGQNIDVTSAAIASGNVVISYILP